MTDTYDIAKEFNGAWSSLPQGAAIHVLRSRYDRILRHVEPKMLPPLERLESAVLGTGGMGTVFGLTRASELSGWVLKLTVDPGEAAVAALICQAPEGEIPGLVPVHQVLDLDIDVIDSAMDPEDPPRSRVFAIWRRLVIPVYDFADKVMEDDLMAYEPLASAAMEYAEYVNMKAESACDAFARTAPTVTEKYVQDPSWIAHVDRLLRDEADDDDDFGKAGNSLAVHLATYIRALLQADSYGVPTLGEQLLSFLERYDIVLCDIAARNVGLMFRTERSKPQLAIYDFGVPRFLTKAHDQVVITRV